MSHVNGIHVLNGDTPKESFEMFLESETLVHTKVDVSFRNVKFEVRSGRSCGERSGGPLELIHGVSGTFLGGQLSAVIGPSGAGKTTFLNILSGFRNSTFSGDVLYNGKPINSFNHKAFCSYVMQDTPLLNLLTVKETLTIASRLQFRSRLECCPHKEHEHKVNQVVTSLGLASCINTLVKDISGGEYKRLSVATELLRPKPVILLDEPTTGLDYVSCKYLIEYLKQLTENGVTLVCTLHQPSATVLGLFDKLCVMESGRFVFDGSPNQLTGYLAEKGHKCPEFHNPANYVIELACDQKLPTVTEYIDSNMAKMTDGKDFLEVMSVEKSNFAVQFTTLCERTLKIIYRDLFVTKLRIACHVVVGLLTGLMYFRTGNDATMVLENVASTFFSVIFLMFTALMSTIMTFPSERKVAVREYFNDWYTVGSYYLARTLIDVPLQVLYSVLYGVIVYFLVDHPFTWQRFLLYLALLIFVSLISQSFGLIVASVTEAEKAVFISQALAVPMILFTGFFVRMRSLVWYLKVFGYLSFTKYAFDGLLQSTFGFNRTVLNCSNYTDPLCVYSDPQLVLDQLYVPQFECWTNIVILCAILFVFRIAIFAGLRMKMQGNR